MKFLFRIFLSIILLFGSQQIFAQSNLSNYALVNDKVVTSFVDQAYVYVRLLYGQPNVPVKNIVVRYCPEAGAFTNLTDQQKGLLTICITHKTNEYAFYGQLAHETAHLLNARLLDVYGEGLATIFSRQMLEKSGKDWSKWEAFYKQGREPFYGQTYFMMSEISGVAGADNMRRFYSFAKMNSDSSNMHIDIDGWIKTLPVQKQQSIKQIIRSYSEAVRQTMVGSKEKYSFIIPK